MDPVVRAGITRAASPCLLCRARLWIWLRFRRPAPSPHTTGEERCPKCRDTGCHSDEGGPGTVYCSCPIGEALGAAWMGTGHEEEAVAAIESMRAFLLASPAPASPATPTTEHTEDEVIGEWRPGDATTKGDDRG